jgi:predicted permease
MLMKKPGFTVVAVLTLALGIGANTAIFTIINAVFLNPLPVADASRLVDVYTFDAKNSVGNFTLLTTSFRNYEDYRDQNDVFSGLADFAFAPLVLSGRGDPQQIPGMLVTANYFDVLGVKPVAGRAFQPDEDKSEGGSPVAVISFSLWTRMFGSDPNIIGSTLTLNGSAYTVIGVAPPGFRGTNLLAQPDCIWIPVSMHAQVLTGPFGEFFMDRRALFTQIVGRLKPGATVEQAEASLKTIAARLEKAYPAENEGRSVRLVPTVQTAIGGANQQQQFVRAGGLLMTMVSLVLLIACVNLANLLLSRAAAREKEMGVRTALGASRRRLLRQLLTESLVLSLLGGAVGLAVADWGCRVLWSFRPPFLGEDVISLQLDDRVFGYTFVISLVTGLLFGLVPALKASDPNLNEVLKVSGRGGVLGWGRGRLRSLLIASEFALAMIALVGAGLFLRSLQQAQRIDPGFESEKLFVMAFNLGAARYDEARGQQFYREAVERARSVPGVEAATISANFPVGGGFGRSVFPEGQAREPGQRGILVNTNPVGLGYFEAVRTSLVRGRDFNDGDRVNTTRVAVVNEAFARRFWPNQEAVGKRFSFFGDDFLHEVVGVVRNTVVFQIGEEPQPSVYLPLRQNYSPFATLQVRTSVPPEQALPTVRQRVQEIDRNLALTNVTTIREILGQGLWAPRMGAALLGVFGVLALVLAAVGIYGVMANAVSQRTQEIGLRMALGATQGNILKLVIRQGMVLALIGVAIGLAASLSAVQFVASLLFGISATDPITFASIPALLMIVALLACYIPARRATKVDPMVALRYE